MTSAPTNAQALSGLLEMMKNQQATQTVYCDDCSKMFKPVFHAVGTPCPKTGKDVAASTPTSPTPPTPPKRKAKKAVANNAYIVPDWLQRIWDAALLRLAAKSGPVNLMFFGPHGSGKTEGAKALAGDRRFVKVDCGSITDPQAIMGVNSIVVEQGVAVTYAAPSQFRNYIEQDDVVILLDEVNRIPDQLRNVLLPLLDGTQQVLNPLDGKTIKRGNNIIVMTGNVGLRYTGTNAIDPAFLSRGPYIPFGYPDTLSEIKILVNKTGVSEQDAMLLVAFAEQVRAKAEIEPDWSPVSTRELLNTSEYMGYGLSMIEALNLFVLNAASREGGDSSVQNRMKVILGSVGVQ